MLRCVETSNRGSHYRPGPNAQSREGCFQNPVRDRTVQQELSAWRDAATANEMNQHRESRMEERPQLLSSRP